VTAEPTPDARETGTGAGTETAVTHGRAEAAFALSDVDASGRIVAVFGAGVVGAVAVERAVAVLANAPFDPVAVAPALRTAVGALALVAVVAALLAVAAADGRPTVRIGLLFAAVFGPLPLVAPGTTLMAVVAVVGGAALALGGALGVPAAWRYRAVRHRVVAVGFVAALALTLLGVTGLLAGARNAGAFVTVAAIAAVGTRSAGSRPAAAAGLLAVAAVTVASAASPFAVGSALLVAFGVTAVPALLVALALAGGVATAVAGLSRGEYTVGVGAVVLLLAGVPAKFPRALTLLLGATLVVAHEGVTTGPEGPR
jgi:hypothetical protein